MPGFGRIEDGAGIDGELTAGLNLQQRGTDDGTELGKSIAGGDGAAEGDVAGGFKPELLGRSADDEALFVDVDVGGFDQQ